MSQPPAFPLDLEREVFEMAALCHPGTIPTLLCVCRRVCEWTEPMLYRILFLSRALSNKAQIAAASSKSKTFLHKAVRHVLVPPVCYLPGTKIEALLAKCSGATNLILLGLFGEVVEAIQHMRPTKLSVANPIPGLALGLDHPLFTNVTHLDLFHAYVLLEETKCAWEQWRSLASLPMLTHLAISPRLARGILPGLLAECQLLTLVVIGFWDAGYMAVAVELVQALRVADPRVVVHVALNFLADWQDAAYGADDFWARGDRFVVCKRNGQIPRTRYLLDEPEA
ncbi:hypothetical protein GGX14DRAFT_580418 [Mycena pura]|uniref:Uncharacterized protein n=1 Tax=Mycena pura TaxID=153505 RepID=A0AAD6XXN8_9AGAR|nr:hypothetical protein GGX14DRAFT_580418 [Mycena pura]